MKKIYLIFILLMIVSSNVMWAQSFNDELNRRLNDPAARKKFDDAVNSTRGNRTSTPSYTPSNSGESSNERAIRAEQERIAREKVERERRERFEAERKEKERQEKAQFQAEKPILNSKFKNLSDVNGNKANSGLKVCRAATVIIFSLRAFLI